MGIKIKGKLIARGLVFSAFVFSSLTSPFASAGVTGQIDIPCINTQDPADFAKQKASGPHAGQRSCKEVRQEVLQKLQDRVRQQADCYYKGWQLDPSAAATGGECPGTAIPRETCNLLSNANGVPPTFSGGSAEEITNHLGASCGDWPYFKAELINVNVSCGWDSCSASATCSVTPDYTRTNHYIEDSYNRGAWIQSLNCYHNQVMLEIQNQGVVKLTSITTPDGKQQEGPCAALQKDYLTALSTSASTSAEVYSSTDQGLGGEKNLADLENCTGNEKSNKGDLNPDVGRLRQSACHLVAARRSLEAMFMHVAACEVWARAGRAYEQFLGGTVTADGVTAQARAQVATHTGSSYTECTTANVLSGYKGIYYGLFKDKANKTWNAQSCGELK